MNPLLLGHNRADDDAGNRAFKNRNDHRHHAIDAFVIAMMEQRLLKRISDLNSNADRQRLIEAIPKPWSAFSHDEMRQRLDNMIVSHKADHGLELRTRNLPHVTSGKLHDGTAYGFVKEPEREEQNNRRYLARNGASPKGKKKQTEAPPNLVCRKAFASLNENEIDRIRDIGLRSLVQQHVAAAKAQAARAGKTCAAKDLAAALKYFADSLDVDQGDRGRRRAEVERLLAIRPGSQTATRIIQLRAILADANLTGNARKHRKEDLRRAERRLLEENGHKVDAASGIQGFLHGIRHVRLVELLDADYLVPVENESGTVYKSYYSGENAFVDIFEMPDGKWDGEAMSVFKANQKNPKMEWPNKFPSARLVMRIFKGDSIALDFNGQRTVMVVRQLDAAAGRFKLAAHNEGGALQDRHESKKPEYKNDPFRWLMASYGTLKELKAERVRVDELGRLWRVRPGDAARLPQ